MKSFYAISLLIMLTLSMSQATDTIIQIDSPSNNKDSYFGVEVVGIENKDGLGNVAITEMGTPYSDIALSGSLGIFTGATGSKVDFCYGPRQNLSLFGYTLASMRDINGDGYGEVLVGAPGESPNINPLPPGEGNGKVYVFSGSQSSHTIDNLVSPNSQEHGGFGRSVSGIGDQNGDGVDEILVVAGESMGGRIYLFSGADGKCIRMYTPPPEMGNGRFYLAKGISDLDGDSYDDIVVEDSLYSESGISGIGRMYFLSGSTGKFIRYIASPSNRQGSYFGGYFAIVPKLTSKGEPGILVGLPYEPGSNSLTDAGRAYLYNATTGDLLLEIVPPMEIAEGCFGIRMSYHPDLDGDSNPETMVSQRPGLISIFHSETGKLLRILYSPHHWEPGGGVNSSAPIPGPGPNGAGSLIVGASGEYTPPQNKGCGRAYIFHLGPYSLHNLLESFPLLSLYRPPKPGELEPWESNYINFAIANNIDAALAAGEVARRYFMSSEYVDLARTDEQFITNCYWAFDSRYRTDAELSKWMNNEDGQGLMRWTRPQALSTFINSPEFAERIAQIAPGKNGDPARNFVSGMYLGMFDRLPEVGGLVYWSGLMDGATTLETKRHQAARMALICLNSEEFSRKTPSPSNSDRVICLYRALFARWPSADEIGYWTAQLDSKAISLEGMTNTFAQTPEFTGRLYKVFRIPFPAAARFWDWY